MVVPDMNEHVSEISVNHTVTSPSVLVNDSKRNLDIPGKESTAEENMDIISDQQEETDNTVNKIEDGSLNKKMDSNININNIESNICIGSKDLFQMDKSDGASSPTCSNEWKEKDTDFDNFIWKSDNNMDENSVSITEKEAGDNRLVNHKKRPNSSKGDSEIESVVKKSKLSDNENNVLINKQMPLGLIHIPANIPIDDIPSQYCKLIEDTMNAEERITFAEQVRLEKERVNVENLMAAKQCLHPSNAKYDQGTLINPPPVYPGSVVSYTPGGQRYEIDLNKDRPTYFKSELNRKQYDDATLQNARRMSHEIQNGLYLPRTLSDDIERRHIGEQRLIEGLFDRLEKHISENSDRKKECKNVETDNVESNIESVKVDYMSKKDMLNDNNPQDDNIEADYVKTDNVKTNIESDKVDSIIMKTMINDDNPPDDNIKPDYVKTDNVKTNIESDIVDCISIKTVLNDDNPQDDDTKAGYVKPENDESINDINNDNSRDGSIVSETDYSDDEDSEDGFFFSSSDDEDLEFLTMELRLLKFHRDVSLMILEHPVECLQQLQDILNLNLTPLIFKKNPQFLDLAKKLMNSAQFPDIQIAGTNFYNKIKSLFVVPDGMQFEDYFHSEVANIREMVLHNNRSEDLILNGILLSSEEIEADLNSAGLLRNRQTNRASTDQSQINYTNEEDNMVGNYDVDDEDFIIDSYGEDSDDGANAEWLRYVISDSDPDNEEDEGLDAVIIYPGPNEE